MTLTLVAAGRTGPNRALAFGDEDRALDDRGRRDVSTLDLRCPLAICGPESSVRQTAALLADGVRVDDTLRSIDLGSWVGRRPEEVPQVELQAWFTDPRAAPHGGESVVAFLGRVRTSLDGASSGSGGVVVAAKPVVQAAVALQRGVGAAGFLGVAIAPASTWTVDISIHG